MNRCIVMLAIFILLSCSSKKKNKNTEEIFPVRSFLQSQVKQVDTSLYRIVKVEKIDTNVTKSYVSREDFRALAKDFLSMPDISAVEWKDDYDGSKMFEEDMKAILMYTTQEKENEIQRLDVILEPGSGEATGKVQTIIVYLIKSNNDSTVIKNMVWYVDKRFTIVTKTQKKNQPEKAKTVEVIWNDFTDQK